MDEEKKESSETQAAPPPPEGAAPKPKKPKKKKAAPRSSVGDLAEEFARRSRKSDDCEELVAAIAEAVSLIEGGSDAHTAIRLSGLEVGHKRILASAYHEIGDDERASQILRYRG